MTFNEFLEQPQSIKIALVEVDTPLKDLIWLNYQDGIWFTTITPGSGDLIDDHGNTAYWQGRNDQYFNIQSLNVNGQLYNEVASLALVVSTESSWFYDTTTTKFYIHFVDWNIPDLYSIVAPGAAIGFTNETADTSYYEDIYYEPLVQSIPNISKKRDALFFGILQFQGGSITFNNANGYFDDFANLDLYGQPVRIKLSFEGLPFDEAVTIYTARVKDFKQDFTSFTLNILDIRKLLSRDLPINEFNSTDHPNMDSKFYGDPIPIAYGEIIKSKAYYIGSSTWQFADTSINLIDSGITVYDKDDAVFSHTGTGTNGTFTGTPAGSADDDKLTVTYSQTSVTNGLSVIEQVLEEYENIEFNAFNYDLTEWNAEKSTAYDLSLWIGKGNIKSSVDVIEEVCNANQGIFDVLADGKFTFRTFDEDRPPTHEIHEDELLEDPVVEYDSDEYLSSVVIGYSKDYKEKEYQEYSNLDFEDEVYGRYRQYKSQPFDLALGNETDAIEVSNTIMNRSKFIFPKVSLMTKIQNIQTRIMDNTLYDCVRQDGSQVVARSLYENTGIVMNISSYEMSMDMRQIKETDNTYITILGRSPDEDLDYYYGGTPTNRPTNIIQGRRM